MTAGRSGVPPAPTRLKLLKGEKANRINRREPTPPPGKAEPEPWLRGIGLDAFQRFTPMIDSMLGLSPIDGLPLSVMFATFADYVAARDIVDRSAVLVKGSKGNLVKNPAAQLARDNARTLLAWFSHYGMTPSARSLLADPRRIYDERESLLS